MAVAIVVEVAGLEVGVIVAVKEGVFVGAEIETGAHETRAREKRMTVNKVLLFI
jgi:hypothetical protein